MGASTVTKMGFEGLIYRGTAGSTAATQVVNHRDVTIELKPEYGDTSRKGTGAGPVKMSKEVCAIDWSLKMNMINRTDDTSLTAFRAAAIAGSPIAIRTKDHASGVGYDGDCNVEMNLGQPFKGEQTFDFTFTVNDSARVPSYDA